MEKKEFFCNCKEFTCPICGMEKPEDDVRFDNENRSGIGKGVAICKDCHSEFASFQAGKE